MKAPEQPWAELSALLGSLAAAPVQAQALLDAQWAEDSARWQQIMAPFVAQAPADWRSAFAAAIGPAAPVRQLIASYELDCRVRLQTERQRGWSIKAKPLHLGWEIVYGEKREQAFHVSLCVESVPLPATPSVLAGLPVSTDNSPLQPTETSTQP